MAKRRSKAGKDPPPKKRRGKSEARRQHNFAHQYSAVPMKLNSILYKDTEIGKAIRQLFNEVAYNMSKVALEVYLLFGYHVLYLIVNGKELPVFDQAFFGRCCAGVMDSDEPCKDESLRESIAFYRTNIRPVGASIATSKYMSASKENLAKEMATAFKNHVALTFTSRLEKYVRIKYQLSSAKAAQGFARTAFTKPEEEGQQELAEWLEIDPYPVEDVDPTTKKKKRKTTKESENPVAGNINHFLRRMYDIMTYYESCVDKPWIKPFDLVPKKGNYMTSFITVAPSTLSVILKLLPRPTQELIIGEMLKSPLLGADEIAFLQERLVMGRTNSSIFNADFHAEDSAITEALWNVLFRVKHLETANRKFARYIKTDGYAVSMMMQKPKDEIEVATRVHEFDRVPEDFSSFETFIGIDPGRTYAVTAYAGVEDENRRSVCPQVSTKRYRNEAKMEDHQRWRCRREKGDAVYTKTNEGLETTKTVNLAKYESAMRSILSRADYLLEFNRPLAFRAWRFKMKRFGMKALHNVADAVLGKGVSDRTKICIGFGDWSQPDGFLKGSVKAPIKKIRAELRKRATVIKIREYNTSQVCSKCNHASKTKNLWLRDRKKKKKKEKKEDEGRLVKCHEVVRCNFNECTTTWQRDVNASRNIRFLLTKIRDGADRPSIFCSPYWRNTTTQTASHIGLGADAARA
jgi:hypothetical protein